MKAQIRHSNASPVLLECSVIGIPGFPTELFVWFLAPKKTAQEARETLEYQIAEYTTGRPVCYPRPTLDEAITDAKRKLDIGYHDLEEIKGFWNIINDPKKYGYNENRT